MEGEEVIFGRFKYQNFKKFDRNVSIRMLDSFQKEVSKELAKKQLSELASNDWKSKNENKSE